jgi:hypothetical protein
MGTNELYLKEKAIRKEIEKIEKELNHMPAKKTNDQEIRYNRQRQKLIILRQKLEQMSTHV